MNQLIDQETDILRQLEQSTLDEKDRRTLESLLDTTRDSLESMGWNSMDIIYNYLQKHSTKKAWRKAYTGSGFTNPQFLISSLMAKDSPLQSILLYHGVGVGKTCAAIAASTDYKNPKQIIVLTPSQTLIKNWKEEFIGSNHCGRYIWNIPDAKWKQMSPRKKTELLNSHVMIMGYLTFANRIETLAKQYKETERDITDSFAMIKAIRTMCNDAIIIMDEIHNTRQVSAKSKSQDDVKKIRPVLEGIARYAIQTKLVLLSATPMYNEVGELEWIMNLMRWNQNMSSFSNKEWLDSKSGEWKVPISRSKSYVSKKVRGFVSFIRGENPYTFPRRLSPSKPRFSVIDEKGITLTTSTMESKMKDYIEDLTKDTKDVFATQTIQNLLSVQNKISHEEGSWTPDVARQWSPKLWTAWEALKDCVGPVFMYSQYLQHGINEMAKILEEMGWVRTGGTHFTKQGGKVDPYCWANKCRRSEISKLDPSKRRPFQQAKYALVDGTSKNLYSILDLANQKENMDGSKCAVLLGSRVIEVGVSLKRFRQAHILEPWFHLNSMEQAVGRVIRNRSHIDLPPESRNLTVFLHCVIDPSGDMTSDLKMYQTSIEKMQMMSQVSKIIASNAIDCDIQLSINYIRDSRMETIKDCYGEILEAPRGDTDFSARCGYSTCEIQCKEKETMEIEDSQVKEKIHDLDKLYSSLETSQVFPTNLQIVIERLPNFIRSMSAVDSDSVSFSLGISKELAAKALTTFVKDKKSFLNSTGSYSYLQRLEGTPDIFIVSSYPQKIVPLETIGALPVREMDNDIRISTLPEPEIVKDEPIIVPEETASLPQLEKEEPKINYKRINQLLEKLNRELLMIEGLTPMRKSIEQKRSLEVGRLNTDMALKKQSAYQRYIGYAEDRKSGDIKIAKKELYSSLVVTYVEHLNQDEKDLFLRYLVETDVDTLDPESDNFYTIMFLKDSLSEDGLGLHNVPFLMKYKKHIEPYIPSDVREKIDAKDMEINAYAFTENNTCNICIWQKDNTWYRLPESVVVEWKIALRPTVSRDKEKGKEDNIWIDAWNNPKTYEFTLKIPRKDPLGKNPVSKKAQVLGGLCGQALFVKNVEELVQIIEKLTDIKYTATSKRIRVGKRDLPKGIYWPRATGTKLLESFYLGGVNKRPSKTSTGASLCEELEYIVRIIAYSGKSHPMSKWITFNSSLEQYILHTKLKKDN